MKCREKNKCIYYVKHVAVYELKSITANEIISKNLKKQNCLQTLRLSMPIEKWW